MNIYIKLYIIFFIIGSLFVLDKCNIPYTINKNPNLEDIYVDDNNNKYKNIKKLIKKIENKN